MTRPSITPTGATPAKARSAKAAEAARMREEARRKLLEAKKAGRKQRKTSDTDAIEVEIVTSST